MRGRPVRPADAVDLLLRALLDVRVQDHRVREDVQDRRRRLRSAPPSSSTNVSMYIVYISVVRRRPHPPSKVYPQMYAMSYPKMFRSSVCQYVEQFGCQAQDEFRYSRQPSMIFYLGLSAFGQRVRISATIHVG